MVRQARTLAVTNKVNRCEMSMVIASAFAWSVAASMPGMTLSPGTQIMSNQISFIGLVTKDYYKRPSGVVFGKGHVGVSC